MIFISFNLSGPCICLTYIIDVFHLTLYDWTCHMLVTRLIKKLYLEKAIREKGQEAKFPLTSLRFINVATH